MFNDGEWIREIMGVLESFGANVVIEDEFSIRVNNELLVFVSANPPEKENAQKGILIREDLFHTRKNQLLMRLKSQLGLNAFKIHGRSTRVEELTKMQAKKFVDENHLLGFGGGKTFLGLFHKGTLVAVGVFSKIRFMKYENPTYYSVELERYCSLADTTVMGGLDKLIRHFEKNQETDDLVTTVDLEGSEGKSFLNLGFTEVARTNPILFAVDQKKFSRRIIESEADLKVSEYLIQNRGNLKLRKRIGR